MHNFTHNHKIMTQTFRESLWQSCHINNGHEVSLVKLCPVILNLAHPPTCAPSHFTYTLWTHLIFPIHSDPLRILWYFRSSFLLSVLSDEDLVCPPHQEILKIQTNRITEGWSMTLNELQRVPSPVSKIRLHQNDKTSMGIWYHTAINFILIHQTPYTLFSFLIVCGHMQLS